MFTTSVIGRPGWPLAPSVQSVRELAGSAALGLDERHHIFAVGQQRAVRRSAQCDVQSRTILGVVDGMPENISSIQRRTSVCSARSSGSSSARASNAAC
jgi:hypothetical protein